MNHNVLAEPQQRLADLCDRAWGLLEDPAAVECTVRPSIPILYFGDLERYLSSPIRVVTAALNPSRHEFPREDPFARFPSLRFVEGRSSNSQYLASLAGYFRINPYRRWFCSSFEPVLSGMNASYFDGAVNTALQTNICSPFATDPAWSALDRSLQSVENEGTAIWNSLANLLEPDVILMSVASRHLARLGLSTQESTSLFVANHVRAHEVTASRVALASGKQSVLVFTPAARQPFARFTHQAKLEIGALVLAELAKGI